MSRQDNVSSMSIGQLTQILQQLQAPAAQPVQAYAPVQTPQAYAPLAPPMPPAVPQAYAPQPYAYAPQPYAPQAYAPQAYAPMPLQTPQPPSEISPADMFKNSFAMLMESFQRMQAATASAAPAMAPAALAPAMVALAPAAVRSGKQSAIIYDRVSTEQQRSSMDSHVAAMQEYARANNIEVLGVYTEVGSAYNFNSIDNLQIWHLLEANRDVDLIVMQVDRLSRRAEVGAKIYRICMEKNINIHVVGNERPVIFNRSTMRRQFTEAVEVGEEESDTKSQRSKAMHRTQNLLFESTGGAAGRPSPALRKTLSPYSRPKTKSRPKAPYGYRYVSKKGNETVLDVGPQELSTIALLRMMVLTGGSIEDFNALFNTLTPYGATESRMGTKNSTLRTDYDEDYECIPAPKTIKSGLKCAAFSIKFIYSLFNYWEIPAQGKPKWTAALMEGAIKGHLGSEALEMCMNATHFCDDD